MNQSSLIKIIATGFFCLTVATSWALPTDKNQPIHINSDTAEVDDLKGVAIYRGNVVIIQGTLNLTADMVTIYNNEKGVSRLEANGEPAHYRQQHEPDEPEINAYGDKITYHVDKEAIAINKNAKFEQENNSFTGERIDYDMKKRTVNAYSNQSAGAPPGSDRVEMVIQPNQKLSIPTNPINE